MDWKIVLVAVLVVLSCVDGQQQTRSYISDPENVQNKQHIREHMGDYFEEGDVEEQLKLDSEEATQFHYFKLHDYDNNDKLDGLELYAAINHFSHDGENEPRPDHVNLGEEQVTQLVDTVLKEDDFNDDGFVDYYEFVQAQKQARERDDV